MSSASFNHIFIRVSIASRFAKKCNLITRSKPLIGLFRCAKIAKDRGLSGPITAPSSYFMKSPLIQYTDDEARQLVEDFVAGEESAQG